MIHDVLVNGSEYVLVCTFPLHYILIVDILSLSKRIQNFSCWHGGITMDITENKLINFSKAWNEKETKAMRNIQLFQK